MLERSDDPSVSELTQIMEVMRMHETYYTPEQLAELGSGESLPRYLRRRLLEYVTLAQM